MKGLLCACLLMSLRSIGTAQAYEADIHYSTTYVLARAVGWSQADALTIASANQAMDENQNTVAALEVDATPSSSSVGYVTSSLRQAERNLKFHCFSKTRESGDGISADVRQVMSAHFAEVPGHVEGAQRNAMRLIALGVALHCQQDAYSHVGFGGSCGAHSGSCHGHSHQTLLDQVVFSVLKKHYFNPDHPGVSGRWLLVALEGTVRELSARRPGAAARSISAPELAALSDQLRASGLGLPDDVRRECNRYIAGKWLLQFLRSRNRMNGGPGTVKELGTDVGVTCRNASLASATVVTIPDPRFPRLNADASPTLVRPDGTYRLVRGGEFAAPLPRIHAAAAAGELPNYHARRIRVQLSHWSQVLALTHGNAKTR